MPDPICTLAGCDQPVADAPVCTRCASRCAAALREAADLWPALTDQVARRTRSGDPTPRAGRPAPAQPVRPGGDPRQDHGTGWPGGLVVDLAASETADAVRNTATTWVRAMWDARWPHGRPARDPGPWCSHDCGHGTCERLWQQAQAQADHDRDIPPDRMAELLRWLADRAEWARRQEFAVELVDELGDAAGRVRRAVDRRPSPKYLGPCSCGADLRAMPGAAQVACGCGAQWDVPARHRWLDGLVKERAYTAAEIADAYPHVRADRIRRWASPRRAPDGSRRPAQLVQRGRDRHGRPLYRLEDVLALARRGGRIAA